MISYKDKSYCLASTDHRCKNTACHRFFSDGEHENAKRWWKGDNPPIAFMDFFDDCERKIEQ